MSKDILLKSINQGQIIEDLLKKKGGMNNGSSEKYNNRDLYDRLDQLNREYIELIKKYKTIDKEKNGL